MAAAGPERGRWSMAAPARLPTWARSSGRAAVAARAGAAVVGEAGSAARWPACRGGGAELGAGSRAVGSSGAVVRGGGTELGLWRAV